MLLAACIPVEVICLGAGLSQPGYRCILVEVLSRDEVADDVFNFAVVNQRGIGIAAEQRVAIYIDIFREVSPDDVRCSRTAALQQAGVALSGCLLLQNLLQHFPARSGQLGVSSIELCCRQVPAGIAEQ